MAYFAHSNELGQENWQSLQAHLQNTAALAYRMAAGIGLADFVNIIAAMHDIGKYSRSFQKKLEGHSIKVDHSTAGAQSFGCSLPIRTRG